MGPNFLSMVHLKIVVALIATTVDPLTPIGGQKGPVKVFVSKWLI
jgi:hypothetical protein